MGGALGVLLGCAAAWWPWWWWRGGFV